MAYSQSENSLSTLFNVAASERNTAVQPYGPTTSISGIQIGGVTGRLPGYAAANIADEKPGHSRRFFWH
jgi:hypothetical protein